jgi:hypothetical protein
MEKLVFIVQQPVKSYLHEAHSPFDTAGDIAPCVFGLRRIA